MQEISCQLSFPEMLEMCWSREKLKKTRYDQQFLAEHPIDAENSSPRCLKV